MVSLEALRQWLNTQDYISDTKILMKKPIAILEVTFNADTTMHTIYSFATDIPNKLIEDFCTSQHKQILETLWIHVKNTDLCCGVIEVILMV